MARNRNARRLSEEWGIAYAHALHLIREASEGANEVLSYEQLKERIKDREGK